MRLLLAISAFDALFIALPDASNFLMRATNIYADCSMRAEHDKLDKIDIDFVVDMRKHGQINIQVGFYL